MSRHQRGSEAWTFRGGGAETLPRIPGGRHAETPGSEVTITFSDEAFATLGGRRGDGYDAAMKLPLCLFPLLCIAVAEAAPPAWEAPLPKGSHTDAVALNKAAGIADAAKLESVKGAKGELRPQEIVDLKPAVAVEGVFRVFLKKEGIALPPDMEGTGPFYVFKTGGAFYLLTGKNFAMLYGPPKSKEDVIPFVKVHDKLFTNPQAELVVSAAETKGFQKIAPPAVTEVKETGDGWEVRAILYSAYRVKAFYEERLRVGRNGMIEVQEKAKVIKEIGPGFMY